MKKSYQSIWGEYEIPEKKPAYWYFGDLTAWSIFKDNELRIAYKHINQKEKRFDSSIPGDIKWNRWALPAINMKLKISPVMPDRSIVVEPENHFRMAKGVSAKIYVRIPIWLKFEAINKKILTLIEIPSVILSNTWFGSFFEGRLCYWISSGARRNIEVSPDRPYLAILPIQIVNNSEENFLVERICLNVYNLSLFQKDNQLWTDELKLYYKGPNYSSEIQMGGKAPPEAAGAKLINPPRHSLKKTITAQAFSSLKDLPGLGYLIK
jgi:hypothetical protein